MSAAQWRRAMNSGIGRSARPGAGFALAPTPPSPAAAPPATVGIVPVLRRIRLRHVVVIAAALAYPWVATPFFTFQIGGQALALGLIALSLTFLGGYGGMVSLAQMTVAGVAAYMVAIFGTSIDPISLGWPWWLAVGFVALLRAVNVGGTGKLPMRDLAALCTELGLEGVRTYIQSGNVVFRSRRSEKSIASALMQALAKKMGRRVDVAVRTAVQLRAVLRANPFPGGKPAQVAVVFLAASPPKGLLDDLPIPGREELRLAGREIYIHYPDGMGRSKLKLPATLVGTARNLNTVAKLVKISEDHTP